ncbi:MAG: hypothetical protein CL910_07300 [Deltaproteobacteria bacterium]|nr:hypothetical protein [Deltaproteobacteria bacterium]
MEAELRWPPRGRPSEEGRGPLSSLVRSRDLPQELTRAEDLPSLPAVAVEILRLSGDEGAGFEDYGQVLASDPVLAAKLLKLANSPMFGLVREVTDLKDATSLLGLRTVQIMALGFSLVSELPKEGGSNSFDYETYWRRSLLFAVAARELGLRMDRPLADEAFLCGLLSHIGQLVMAHATPQNYEAVLRRSPGWPNAEVERNALGFDHHEVADAVLGGWGIPDTIRVPVVSWEDGGELGEAVPPRVEKLRKLLSVARSVVALACDEDKGVALTELHGAAVANGMDPPQMDALVLLLEHHTKDTMELLDLKPGEAEDHYTMLSQAREQMVQLSIGTAVDLNRSERRSRKLESQVKRLSRKLIRDPLTGLGNRAHFDAILESEIKARVQRDVEGFLGVLIVDVDNFKELNDSLGHPAGDELLRTVGQAISSTSRSSDIPARIGGDEFAIVVPSCDAPGLLGFANRLRRFIAETEVIIQGRPRRMTASIGGAMIAHPECAEDGKLLIAEADRQLYASKKAGRDCVSVSAVPVDEAADATP